MVKHKQLNVKYVYFKAFIFMVTLKVKFISYLSKELLPNDLMKNVIICILTIASTGWKFKVKNWDFIRKVSL